MRHLSSAIAAAFIAAAVSCNKIEEPIGVTDGDKITVKATMDDIQDPDSKVSFVKTDGQWFVNWSSGDKIAVNGITSGEVNIDGDDPRLGTFTISGVSSSNLYALSPASQFVSGSFDAANSKFGSITLPAVQNAIVNGIDPEACLMFAKGKSSDPRLNFSCGVAFLKFTISDGTSTTPTRSIKISALGGEDMSGQLDYKPGSAVLRRTGMGGKTVTVGRSQGFSHKKVVFAAIVAREYSKGIKLTITDTDGLVQEIQDPRPFTAEAGMSYKVNISYNPLTSGSLKISWGTPVDVFGKGGFGYPRMHRLNNGKLMIMSTINGTVMYATSLSSPTDITSSTSWSGRSVIANYWTESGTKVICANPEFVQLSPKNPYHPGRIIFAVNLRPENKQTSVYPYSIGVKISDDNGSSWTPDGNSEPTIVYASQKWPGNVQKGAWEPFLMELPDGRVQLYFTDNTPYYAAGGAAGNNITVIESADGGDSWGSPRIVCHTEGGWDGMPAAIRYDNRLYLLVEHKDARDLSDSDESLMYPMTMQAMSTTLDDDWSSEIGGSSSKRFYPFTQSTSIGTGYYRGAPYIISTPNYLVLSCQSARNSSSPRTGTEVFPEVFACTHNDISNGKFTNMRTGSWNFPPMPSGAVSGKYSSLCDLGGDKICCLSEVTVQSSGNGTERRIFIIPGTISGQ